MPISRRDLLAGIALGPRGLRAAVTAPDFHNLAPTPPMGWNSWDCYATTINEDAALANAAVMAEKLLPHGYNIFTIDAQWYEPLASGFEYRKDAQLTMDPWGRLNPAPNRFPSAVPGGGFRPLAARVHRLGLKFGIHMMRGVPRLAADQNLPILGTPHRCGDIAERVDVCEWNTDMYGIDMSKPGAQAYYDSVIALYASWDVDFIKADDMSRPYFRNAPEIHAVRRAIDRTRRPMLLSLSPGETPLAAADDVARNANLWRISDDFWDTWPLLVEQFERLKNWSAQQRPGSWPDADMLPLGTLELGRRETRFTPDEQVTLMTLWSIARAPLMVGAGLVTLDEATLALLTNDEVLAVNQASSGSREVYRRDNLVVWQARSAHDEVYVAHFNLNDPAPDATAVPVPIQLTDVGMSAPVRVRDLWQRLDLVNAGEVFAPPIPAHGAGLYRLSAA
ncbi:MAG TPA: glycoside hydrolase family 27 protein [Steroidobacteraceae bacterium]